MLTILSIWQPLQVLKGMFCRHTGRIDDRWARFMKFQISRARAYFADAHAGVNLLDENARWPVWSALILYRCALFAFICWSVWTILLPVLMTDHSCVKVLHRFA